MVERCNLLVQISNNPTGSYAPEISVYGDNVYVIWMESVFPSNAAEISIAFSNDGGVSFSDITQNILGTIPEPYARPSIFISSGGEKIYIVWSQSQADSSTADMYALAGHTVQK